MKIKNQFRISIIVFVIILIISSISVTITNQQVTQLSSQQQTAQNIQTGVSTLNYLSNNYFLSQDQLQLTNWQQEFSILSDDLAKLNSTSPEQQTLVNNIKDDLEILNTTFAGVVSFLEASPRNVSVRVLPVFQSSWSRMAVQNQALAFDTTVLYQSIVNHADQLRQINIIVIFVSLSLFAAYFILNYLITYRRTSKSISNLQTGIEIVGSGKLDYSIKTNSTDEIGEISSAVNRMATNLRNVTASKSDLEREIAERKQAEESLRESEQRWATTLASIGDAVIATDISGKIMFLNGEAEELTGWALRETLTKPVKTVFNIINEQTRLEVENPIDKVLREGIVVGLANHTVLIRKDGSKVPIDDSGAPIKDKDGKTTGVVLIFRDITERKRSEEQTQRLLGDVQQERDRLSSLINSISDEVWFADSEKKFVLANPSAVKEFKLGSSSRNIDVENLAATSEVYRPDGSARPPEEAPPLRALKGEVLKNQEEIVKTPSSGELRYRQVSSAPVRNGEGNIIGSVSVVRDITELKQLQNRLQKYNEELERLVEERTKQLKDSERLAAIGATAGMVGHDIRNPLQAITGDVYLSKIDVASLPEGETRESLQENLEAVEKNVEYINKIVADLQDYARPIKPSAQEVDLEAVIQNLLAKNGVSKNIKVTSRVENNAKKIVADPDMVKRILGNLVNNAVQAMPEGGRLSVRAFREANNYVITVKDSGVGIPEEAKAKLFTPLFTTKSKGQGFGLAVVKRMTEALGGSVTFESQEGKGTTFIVRLPTEHPMKQTVSGSSDERSIHQK